VVLVELVLLLGEESIGVGWRGRPLLVVAVVLVELVLPLGEESIGVGWRRCMLLGDAVVLVELVFLLGEEASVLVGDGDRCCWLQWCSSSWCSSSGTKHWRWMAKVTAAVGGSGARRASVLLLERQASVLVGDGDCCWWMQWCSSSWCSSSGRASVWVGEHWC
jgi:hypothetical protein